jgi:hypothetical protein
MISVQTVRRVSECVAGDLLAEFHQLPPGVITAAVREAERDLAGQIVPGSLGELLHRLAAYRLEQQLGQDASVISAGLR